MGDDVDATITTLTPFGAVARIAEGLEGLIHVSELSPERVGDPSEVVRVGDTVKVRVVGIDMERDASRCRSAGRGADRYPSRTAIEDAPETRRCGIAPV